MRLLALLCGTVALVACVDDPNVVFDMMAEDASDAASLDLADAADPGDGGLGDMTLPPLFVETNGGLSSGYFVGVAAAANGTVYAASYYRAFASNNGGANWTLLDPPRTELALWTAIALNRANPQHVVLGDEAGRVMRSLDGGASFAEVLGTGTLPRPTGAIAQLAYLSDDTILAMAHDRMYRWNGMRWNDQTGDFAVGSLFVELAVDDASPPRAYAATDQQISTYDVATDEWTPLRGAGARSVAAWGVGAARLWGYISDETTNLELPGSPVNPLGCGRPNDNFLGYGLQILDSRIFATDGGYVAYRNRDCVDDWEQDLLAPLRLDMVPASSALTVTQTEDHETIYLGTNQGVLQSVTLGDPHAWIDRTEGLRAADVWGLASATTVPTRLWAATERGLYETSNAGATWQPVATSGTTILPKSVAVLQVEVGQERVLVRTADQRIFFTDDGLTWLELDPTHRTNTFAIAIERTDKTVMYRCSELGVERMVTGLGLWQVPYTNPVEGPASCIAMLVHPMSPTHVYAIDSDNKLWRSNDRGAMFVSDAAGGAFTAWALDPRNASRVLLARGAQILDLTDGVAGSLNPNNPTTSAVDSIVVDPTPSSKVLYIATHDGGLYRSVDGFNFAPYDRGLPHARAQFLWIDPAAPTVLRVALQHLGVWRNN